MKFKDLQALNKEQLVKKKEELQLELMKDRAQMSAGTPPKNPGLMKERRKTIAKIRSLQANQHE